MSGDKSNKEETHIRINISFMNEMLLLKENELNEVFILVGFFFFLYTKQHSTFICTFV